MAELPVRARNLLISLGTFMHSTLDRGWFGWPAIAVLLVLTGCSDGWDSVRGTGVYDPPNTGVPASCAIPGEGCPCDQIGEFEACGDVEIRSGDYVTCSMGSRECKAEGVWGECIGDHVVTQYDPPSSRRTLAVTGPTECVANPCDPYCQYTEDDGQNVADLPDGTCQSPTGGVVLCDQACGYTGPHGSAGYASLPSAWRRLPASCAAATDACGYDANCTSTGACADWGFPCYDPAPPGCMLTKKIDLQLGPPCAAGTTYHFQVCNRGADRADAGTIRIGLYSNSALITTTPITATVPGAPNRGSITFTLGTTAGTYIDPGRCIDINPGNSTASSVNLTAIAAVAVNYNASLSECNLANNWQVFNPTNVCTGCTGLECNQTCASANLTGKIYDPGGVNPVPGVVVYVPNGTVAPLVDGVACDTCATLYSGTPIASAVTAADGAFTLTNVPTGVNFPLVIQIGRWRRQVTVSAITGTCGAGTPTASLPRWGPGGTPGSCTATSPPSTTCVVHESSRLPSKKSEGDIPKIAITMSAGDHLQCLLRKIGIEDAEFTDPTGTGRIHLYAYNGMTLSRTSCGKCIAGHLCPSGVACPGSGNCPSTNGTCGTDLWSSPTRLDTYSAIIAPCDKNPFGGTPGAYNPYVGCNAATATCPGPIGYAAAPYVPGTYANFTAAQTATNPLNTDKPAFPTYPDFQGNPGLPPGPSATQRANMKAYIDKGGRLFSTHWMAYFMTHESYPAAVNYDFGDYVDRDRGPPDFPFTIVTASPLGATLAAWLGTPTVTFERWRHLSRSVNAPAIALASGDSRLAPVSHPSGSSSGWGGPQVSALQFDTPWGVPAANQCGRVVIAQSHVSESTSTTNQQLAFPGACNTAAMSGEEKAFEFLLFSTTQCVGLVTPPPPAPPLMQATFTYDYDSDCPDGSHPEWQFFQWQANVPALTSIEFEAQTADTQGALGAASPVGVGTASATTTAWTSDTNTVDFHLKGDMPAQPSRRWLRISATLNPNGTTSPTLSQWRQTFNCVPAE